MNKGPQLAPLNLREQRTSQIHLLRSHHLVQVVVRYRPEPLGVVHIVLVVECRHHSAIREDDEML